MATRHLRTLHITIWSAGTMTDIVHELIDFERQCFESGQLEVAELATVAKCEIQRLQARLAEAEAKVERMREEVERAQEDKAIAEGLAHDNGLYDARNGVQEVFTDPEAEPESCGFIAFDKPLCRIKWYEDSGDPDVGIQGVSFWCLDENQAGTALEYMGGAVKAAKNLIDSCNADSPNIDFDVTNLEQALKALEDDNG